MAFPMNDTLSVKKLLSANINATAVSAAQLDSVVLSFPRVASSGNTFDRQNLALGSLSPTVLRVAHQPRSVKTSTQRSLFSVTQTLTRVDALSNPIGATSVAVKFQCDIPKDVTLAEYRAAVMILLGSLLESDGAVVTAMFNGEY